MDKDMETILSFEKVSLDKLGKVVAEFRNAYKPTLSNLYAVPDGSDCEVAHVNGVLLLRVREYDYYRLYVLSNNKDELENLLMHLEKGKYVLNIPSKSSIDEWNKVLSNADFSPYATYYRYSNTRVRIKEKKTSVCEEAKVDDAQAIYKLFIDNFDKRTDHIPCFEQFKDMIRNKQVLVTRGTQNEIVGFILFTFEGKKFYMNAWVDQTGQGIFLLYEAFYQMINKGLSYCYFWVKSTNVSVMKIHEMFGAKKDGLVDYTYIN
jgi:hypothetical protein